MYAYINTCRTLFPDRKGARSTRRLIKLLNEGKKRLQLMLIMSWHEDIKLDKIQSLREGGIWNAVPALVQIREEAANFMAKFAKPRT